MRIYYQFHIVPPDRGAKILGVEVAKLFKTTPAEKRVSGYVEYPKIVYRIHSIEDLNNLINIINTKQ